jgi:hypothetical protein
MNDTPNPPVERLGENPGDVECCQTCRYFATDRTDTGVCMRYPPRLFMVTDKPPTCTVDAVKEPVEEAYEWSNWFYPAVDLEGWCGEYESKGDPDD